MILTAIKPVNARVGRPSVNAPNPSYRRTGEKITVKRKAWGDPVNNNNVWVLSDENDFYTSEGFQLTDEFKALPVRPPLFDLLNITTLWQLSKGEEIRIGIIDNGVNNQHNDLQGRVVHLNNHSPVGLTNHGTTMACICAASDEKEGKTGVAPMVDKIFSYQLFQGDSTASVTTTDFLNALDRMAEASVQIINMSFTCDTASFFPDNDSGRRVQEKINSLLDRNIILVCATGNNRRHSDLTPKRFPAGYENLFSVTGYNFSGNIDVESNCWNGVSIATLQEHYFEDDQFEHSNGTSGASAIITGCIACAYNKTGPSKTSTIRHLFSQMPSLQDSFGEHFSVPKFDIKRFIDLINQPL